MDSIEIYNFSCLLDSGGRRVIHSLVNLISTCRLFPTVLEFYVGLFLGGDFSFTGIRP